MFYPLDLLLLQSIPHVLLPQLGHALSNLAKGETDQQMIFIQRCKHCHFLENII